MSYTEMTVPPVGPTFVYLHVFIFIDILLIWYFQIDHLEAIELFIDLYLKTDPVCCYVVY